MSVGKRRRKAKERIERERKLNAGRHISQMLGVCPNCGDAGPHFCPPSLGEPGFYMCEKKEHRKGCRCIKCRAAKLGGVVDEV